MQNSKWVYYFLSKNWDRVNRAQLKKEPKCSKCGKKAVIAAFIKEKRDPYKTTLADLESRCWKCYCHHEEE